MRLGRLALAIGAALGAAACDDAPSGDRGATDARPPDGAVVDAASVDAASVDAASPDAASVDAASVDAASPCAIAPTGAWDGTARIRGMGAGGFDETSAVVHWSLISSTGCVDHYRPSGTATYDVGGNCDLIVEPPSAAIDPTDGELILDRTSDPATYTLTGASSWPGDIHCANEPADPPGMIGGQWAQQRGTFDGAVISGNLSHDLSPQTLVTWRLTRADAVFAPPGPACAEPASEHWETVTASNRDRLTATASWARTSTTGCVDTFAPQGTIVYEPWPAGGDCVTRVVAPTSAPLEAGDGTLTIDRSTDPATFRVDGRSTWPGTDTCTYADGTVEVRSYDLGGPWAGFAGAYDGDRFGATVDVGEADYGWRFSRP